MVKKIPLQDDEIIFLKGKSGIVGVAKFAKNGHIFIGTPDKEEVVIFLEKKDIIAVSSLKSDPLAEKGIKSLIFLLRDLGAPLVVLPENHPTSRRLPMVASCGKTCAWIVTSHLAPILSKTYCVLVMIFPELR